jgi:hypothetical protein
MPGKSFKGVPFFFGFFFLFCKQPSYQESAVYPLAALGLPKYHARLLFQYGKSL